MSDWPVIGVDESGKGDFFGPLVVAGALIAESDVPFLENLGVRDSKTIADKKILALADSIKKQCDFELVVIGPEKYNQLYARIRNLNRLLGWAHARVIENILGKQAAALAISDKFGNERFIIDNLQEKGKAIRLVQMVRGEAHPAVAAASVLARAEFLRRMDELSRRYGMTFPLGASGIVDAAGRSLVANRGEAILTEVAKTHFKNYQKIVS